MILIRLSQRNPIRGQRHGQDYGDDSEFWLLCAEDRDERERSEPMSRVGKGLRDCGVVFAGGDLSWHV